MGNLAKAKKNLQNLAWCQGQKFNAKVHDLSYFFWETTLSCNLSCRHCGSDCGSYKNPAELPKEKVIKVFRDIADNYKSENIMVAVTGGEPLVRRDLFEILTEVSSMGFPWGMVTNGMLVDEKIVEQCAASGMKTVSVSIDGMKDSHNWLRNNEHSYSRAINALKLFLNSGKFQVVEAITCVNANNIDELEEMYETFRNIGVQGWRLFTIFPKGRAENHKEILLNKELLIKLFEFIKDKRKSNSEMYVSYSEEGYLGCDWEREVRDEFFYCGAGIHVGGLLSDGSYSACPSLSREWIQGHVDKSDFSMVWEEKYGNMRNRKWMKTDQCAGCKQWNKCSGSSLHLWDWKENKTKICHYKLIKASKMET
jgi:radical SAM enzyme (rSAM/lipoprotein system)